MTISAIVIPSYLKAKADRQFTGCQSNCKEIGMALEMYSVDHAGRYPTAGMNRIEGKYTRVIPTCPSAGDSDVYTSSYQAGMEPDMYKFFCNGENLRNAGIEGNYPVYGSTRGLIPR